MRQHITGLLVAAAALSAWPAAAGAAAAPPFSAYPAKPYTGAVVVPGFRGAQRAYAEYRSRIRQSLSAGIRFGGHYALAVIGFGAGCRFGYITDLKTGLVYDLPLGGEDYPVLLYRARPDSNLLQAQWETAADDGGDPACARQDFVWTGSAFRPLGSPRIAREECPAWDDAAG
jgi:hypothetical protein